MPLSILPKETILANEISYVLAGNIVSDVGNISVIRQMLEGDAASLADLYYALYTTLQGWYLRSAEGVDLDIRGQDMGLARDPGQAASDPVLFTTSLLWVDDIALPAQQVVQATLVDGTTLLYRSLGEQHLLPSGRSVSGAAPSPTITAGLDDALALDVDGDGLRTVSLGTQTSATAIAAAIQAAVRALAPLTPANLPAYTTFRCDFSVTTPGRYTLRSGTTGASSSVVVTDAGAADASHTLKLGLANGGLEQVGMTTLSVPVICDTIGVLGNVGAGQINQLVSDVPGIVSVANPLMFSNGREPASDDAYRQDITSYVHAFNPGDAQHPAHPDAIERIVARTLGADGQRHVLSSQVAYGAGTIQVWVCDGRSLTVGAQSDVIEDVQDELDGLGQEIGGWVPGGNVAGVASAAILTVDVAVTVRLGPTPDLASAQHALRNAIYLLLYGLGVGQGLSYATLVTLLDQTVVEMLGVTFTMPAAFSTNPPSDIGGVLGQKLMPGTIVVTVERI